MAQWITRLTTDQKIPGSNPGTLVLLLTTDCEESAVQQNKLMHSVSEQTSVAKSSFV